jgi:hypothetical protein
MAVGPRAALSPRATHTEFNLTGSGTLVVAGACLLCGWSITNGSASAVAELDLYDNTTLVGPKVFPVTLYNNESDRDWFAPPVLMRVSIYANVAAGQVLGSIFWQPADV